MPIAIRASEAYGNELFSQELILNASNLHDTCGVNNLHGVPGILAGLISILMAFLASEDVYGPGLYTAFPAMAPEFANGTEFKRLEEQYGADHGIEPGLGRTASQQAECFFS